DGLLIPTVNDILIGSRVENANKLVFRRQIRDDSSAAIHFLAAKRVRRCNIQDLGRSNEGGVCPVTDIEAQGHWVEEILHGVQPSFTLNGVFEVLVPVTLGIYFLRVVREIEIGIIRVWTDGIEPAVVNMDSLVQGSVL